MIMKKLISHLLLLVVCCCLSSSSDKEKEEEAIVVAYVTSWSSVIPDPSVITHINYAFAHVTDSFNGVRIDQEERLKSIIALKQQKPSLKVLLSIGGWESGRFSEMAASAITREAFAKDCKRVADAFQLDGIDIDWEYPTSKAANISASPDDTKNFTLLMKEIRAAIGKKKLLTLASVASGQYIDFADIAPVVDFVNIMAYDISTPPYHHASLFRSDKTSGVSCQEAVAAHVKAGMPIRQLVLGIPFYGRGTAAIQFCNYKDIIKLEGFTRQWDDVAKVPYLTDSIGKMVCGYEDARSIQEKCKYLRSQGMRGAMYWDYDGDDEQGTLRKAVYNGLMKAQ